MYMPLRTSQPALPRSRRLDLPGTKRASKRRALNRRAPMGRYAYALSANKSYWILPGVPTRRCGCSSVHVRFHLINGPTGRGLFLRTRRPRALARLPSPSGNGKHRNGRCCCAGNAVVAERLRLLQ